MEAEATVAVAAAKAAAKAAVAGRKGVPSRSYVVRNRRSRCLLARVHQSTTTCACARSRSVDVVIWWIRAREGPHAGFMQGECACQKGDAPVHSCTPVVRGRPVHTHEQ